MDKLLKICLLLIYWLILDCLEYFKYNLDEHYEDRASTGEDHCS